MGDMEGTEGNPPQGNTEGNEEQNNQNGEIGPEGNNLKPVFICPTCGAKFTKKYNRDRHFAMSHNNISRAYECRLCGAVLDNTVKLQEHRRTHKPTTGFEEVNSAFRKKCVLYRKTYPEKMNTLENAFIADRDEMFKLIEYEVEQRKSIKLGLIMHAEFARVSPQFGGAAGEDQTAQVAEETLAPAASGEIGAQLPSTSAYQAAGASSSSDEDERDVFRERRTKKGEKGKKRRMRKSHHDDSVYVSTTDTEGEDDNAQEMNDAAGGRDEGANRTSAGREGDNLEEELYEVCLRAPTASITHSSNIRQILSSSKQYMQNRIDDFIENGSGWRLNQILCADMEIGNCAPLNGSCNLISLTHLKSIDKIKKSKADQKCFLLAIASYFLKTDNVPKLNKFIAKHLVVNVSSPVKVADIPKFEKDNYHLNFKINVVYEEDEGIYPVYFSKRTRAKYIITLLLYKTKIGDKLYNHYCLIRDVDNFLKQRYKCVSGKYSYEQIITCLNCFSKFKKSACGRSKLERHYEHCIKNKPQAVSVPLSQTDDTIKFKNFVNQFESYYIGFFDFESKHVKEKYECSKCKKVKEGDDTVCTHKTLVVVVSDATRL